MPTVKDLGKKIKKDYPGQFDNLDDITLGAGVKRDNPGEWDDYEDITPKSNGNKAEGRSLVSKTFEAGERALAVASDPTTRKVLGPLARRLPIGDEAKANIRGIEEGEGIAYPADVLEEVFPIMKSLPEGSGANIQIGGMSVPVPGAKTIGRIAADVAFDPLTYGSFGTKTIAGATASAARQAIQTGTKIKLTSKLAKDIAKQAGAAKPTPALIQKYLKQVGKTEPKTFSESVTKGEKSIASFGVGKAKAEITGKLAGKVIKPLSIARRGVIVAKLESGIKEMLSTKTGDPEFDLLYSQMKDVVWHKEGLEIKDGKELNKTLQNLSRELGIPREQLVKQITSLSEKAIVPTKKISVRTYGKVIFDALDTHYTDKMVDAQVALKNAHRANDAAGIEKFGKQVADYNGELNKLNGHYTPPPNVDPKIAQVVKDLNQKRANQLLNQQTSGIRATPLLADREYIAHVMTPETRQVMLEHLASQGIKPGALERKNLSEWLANSVRRQFVEVKPIVADAWAKVGLVTKKEAKTIKGKNGIQKLDELLDSGRISDEQFTDAVHTLSVEEVNTLGQQGKLSFLGNKSIPEVFHVDPVYSTTVRGVRGVRATGAADFFNEMRARGLALPDAKAPADWVNVRQAELGGHKVSPDAAKVLDKWNKFDTDPNELRNYLRYFDTAQNWLKSWALAIFPSYHTKNMVGNFWNNWLAGVNNPDVYRQAAWIQKKKHVAFTGVFGKRWTTPEIAKRAAELAVVDRGWFGADIQRTLKQELEGGKWLTLSTRSHLIKGGFRAGRAIENNARMAHFIDRLRKGDTAEHAALSVKKFLFDYADLSDVERKALNRVFFFYTWTRKNLPLQLHSLVTNPAKFSLPFKAKHEIEKNTQGPNEKALPEWMKENFPIRIRKNNSTGNHEYFLLNSWLPASDLVKISHLHDVALNMISPLIKEPLEYLFNYDTYFKRKVERFAGEKVSFNLLGTGRREYPAKVVNALKAIRLLNEVDKMTKTDTDLFNKIVSFTTGKLYPYEEDEAARSNNSRVDGEMQELKAAIARENRKSPVNEKEIARIQSLLQEKAKEY